MEPIVDLAPGADSSPLAAYFARRVRDALSDPKRKRSFFALKAAIFAVDFDSGNAVTLRFDHGRLTVHEGAIGVPSVTFGGPLRALTSLHRLRIRDLPRALVGARPAYVSLVEDEGRPSTPPPPQVRVDDGSASVGELARLFAEGELRVYGLLSHPRTVYRFLRLLGASQANSS